MFKKVFLLVLFLFLAVNASATTNIYECVDLTNGMVFGSSYENQTITPCAGTYNLPNGIVLRGEGIIFNCNNGVELVGSGTTNNSIGIQIKNEMKIIVKNCTVRNYQTGIRSGTSMYILQDNTLIDNGKGIHVIEETVGMVHGSNILGNTITGSKSQGIYVTNVMGIEVSDNTLSDNTDQGIYFDNVGAFTVKGNAITNSEFGIYLKRALGGNLTSNTVTENSKYGLYVFDNSIDVLIRDNNVRDNGQGGIFVDSNPDIRLNSNIVENNPIGLKMNKNADNLKLADNQFCNNTTADIDCDRAHQTSFSNDYFDKVNENQCGFNSMQGSDTVLNCSEVGQPRIGPPGSVGPQDIDGISSDSYTKSTVGSKTTFTLSTGNVYFYSSNINVIAFQEELENTDFFIKIPSETTLMPCSEEGCVFAGDSPPNSVEFDSSIAGIILDGTLDTRGQYNTALNLVIEGDINSTPNTNSGKIISSGKDGANGQRTEGEDAGNAGNIEVRGTVFVQSYSTLVFEANGGNGGDGADGYYHYTLSDFSPDCVGGEDGGNAGSAGNIEIENLVLSKTLGVVKFNSNGGNAGTGGKRYSACEGGEDGLAGNGRNTKINNILFAGSNSAPSGQPILYFSALKGSTANPVDASVSGTASIKGCNLEGNLRFFECNVGKLNIYSNDSIELIGSSHSRIKELCLLPATQAVPRINCACYSGSIEETDVIFSLTGTVKSFSGKNLSGDFQNFVLSRKDLTLAEEELASDSATRSFSDGFFNFSFGKEQSIFNASSLGKLNFGFMYLLDFAINAAELTSFSQGKFNLATGEEEEQPCGE